MLIGASIAAEDIEFYEPLLPGNDIMRIFPVGVTVGGIEMKIFPPWSDQRLAYCRRKSVVPFLSCKIDGDSGGLLRVRQQLEDMPAWVDQVFVTDRHEPEGDLDGGPAAYRRNFTRFLEMVDTLPVRIRKKVRCGPVLTQTWTENKKKGNFDYRTYDPGVGDFFGVDCYVPAGTERKVVSPATVPSAPAFLRHIKAYAYSATDGRPRIFPELGLIGMPADTDGAARAAWIRGVHDEVSTWRRGMPGWGQPWSFLGWIWWNQQGKNTGKVAVIGGRRDFPLDDRTVDRDTVAKLRPPKPLNAFNAIWSAQERPGRPGRPHSPEPMVVA